jgi:hypothetical protein
MANKPKEKEKTPADFQRYAFANVAATMSKSKADAMYLPGAVNLLEKNLDFGTDGKDLYDQYVNDKQVNKLIDIYNKKYNSKMGEASVGDVYDFYKPALNGTTDEQRALIDSTFGKYAGENYRELMGKIEVLRYKAKAPEGAISPEEREKAGKELKEYDGLLIAEDILSKYNFENMRMQAVEASKPGNFGGLEEILRKSTEPEQEKGKK